LLRGQECVMPRGERVRYGHSLLSITAKLPLHCLLSLQLNQPSGGMCCNYWMQTRGSQRQRLTGEALAASVRQCPPVEREHKRWGGQSASRMACAKLASFARSMQRCTPPAAIVTHLLTLRTSAHTGSRRAQQPRAPSLHS